MRSDQIECLQHFVEYAQKLKGDGRGEAQVFCDRLFQAFGHAGYKEGGRDTGRPAEERKARQVDRLAGSVLPN